MKRKFRFKRYSSKLMVVLRVLDASILPLILLGLLRFSGTPCTRRIAMIAAIAILMTIAAMEAVGLYRRWRGAHLVSEIHTILTGWAFVSFGVFVVGLATKALAEIPGDVLAMWLVFSPGGICAMHGLARAFLCEVRRRGANHRTALIIGAGAVGRALAKKLCAVPWAGVDVVGFLDDDTEKQGVVIDGLPVLGTPDDLGSYVAAQGIDMVYLALPMRAQARIQEVVTAVHSTRAAIYMVPDIFMFDLLGSQLIDLDGIPVVSLSESPQIGPAGAIKRLEDVVLASVGLVLLAPLFLLLAILVKLSSPGPVFYGHQRVGQHGRKFRCYKFRSMVRNGDEVLSKLLARDPDARREWEENYKLRKDPRVTKIGAFLRRTSLDELPQLFNVLRGDMSLVGPRPIIEDEITKYGRFYRHFALVRPGITGLWQVSGRNEVSYEQRVQLDVEYAENWSVWKDIHILAKTVSTVLAKEASY